MAKRTEVTYRWMNKNVFEGVGNDDYIREYWYDRFGKSAKVPVLDVFDWLWSLFNRVSFTQLVESINAFLFCLVWKNSSEEFRYDRYNTAAGREENIDCHSYSRQRDEKRARMANDYKLLTDYLEA